MQAVLDLINTSFDVHCSYSVLVLLDSHSISLSLPLVKKSLKRNKKIILQVLSNLSRLVIFPIEHACISHNNLVLGLWALLSVNAL